jgi:hypothetical protein
MYKFWSVEADVDGVIDIYIYRRYRVVWVRVGGVDLNMVPMGWC